MVIYKKIELIRERHYVAEIEVGFIDDNTPWSPIMEKKDVYKVDRVRLALRRGDVKAAAKEAKVFELLPLAGE